MLKKIFQPIIPEQFPDLSGLLEKQYNHQVAQNHIQHDNAQFIALQQLQTLLDNILASVDYDQNQSHINYFHHLRKNAKACIYLVMLDEANRC